jgi:hypothetical protein
MKRFTLLAARSLARFHVLNRVTSTLTSRMSKSLQEPEKALENKFMLLHFEICPEKVGHRDKAQSSWAHLKFVGEQAIVQATRRGLMVSTSTWTQRESEQADQEQQHKLPLPNIFREGY